MRTGETEPREQPAESSEQLATALRAQQRRIVDSLAEQPTVDATPILRADERLSSPEYVTLVYELHHVHLPELARRGLVRFDRRTAVVTRGDRFDERAALGDERATTEEVADRK